jgi:hypothetical protein
MGKSTPETMVFTIKYGVSVGFLSLPIGSMYGTNGNIYHEYTPVMLPYIAYMDPMGYGKIYTGNHGFYH